MAPCKSYTVVGLGKISGVSIGGATLAVFDVPTAASILNKSGYDGISVAAKPGVSESRLAAEIKPLLPPAAQVRTGSQQASHDAAQITAGTSLVKYILLAFGAIALFVGAFVIFNTISITVAQRTRELATLRTLGASRRQVRGSVMLESFVIGLAASAVGLFAGLGLAKGLNAAFVALGIDLPQAATVLAARTIIVSLLVGTLVTLGAGLFPAIRATRVPPISAVREGAVLPASPHAHRRPYVAGAVMLLGLAVIVQGLFASSGAGSVLVLLGAGTLLLFIGVALVSSYVVRPLASVVGRPARALGGAAGRLAVANSVRNTSRTAATDSGVDDRPRADRLRRDPRRRPAQLDQRRARQAGHGRLPSSRRLDRQRFLPGADGVGAGPGARRGDRLQPFATMIRASPRRERAVAGRSLSSPMRRFVVGFSERPPSCRAC